MGEKSKKIGEYGEDYAEKFFNSVGWDSLSKGIELKCSNNSSLKFEYIATQP